MGLEQTRSGVSVAVSLNEDINLECGRGEDAKVRVSEGFGVCLEIKGGCTEASVKTRTRGQTVQK